MRTKSSQLWDKCHSVATIEINMKSVPLKQGREIKTERIYSDDFRSSVNWKERSSSTHPLRSIRSMRNLVQTFESELTYTGGHENGCHASLELKTRKELWRLVEHMKQRKMHVIVI